MNSADLNSEKLLSLYKNCRLCPRDCRKNRFEKNGFCGANFQMEISRIAPHFGEEPCISGKNGAGTIFFCHCNLNCIYCQNSEISCQNANGRIFTPKQLSFEMLKLQQLGVHNIELVTPTHYLPSVALALIFAKKAGLSVPVVYNCSGFESVETLQLLTGLVDVYLPDFKYFSPSLSQEFSHTADYFDHVILAIEEMFRQQPNFLLCNNGILQRGLLIRHLVLPGEVQNTKQVLRAIAKRWGNRIPVSLMQQYTPINRTLPGQLNRKVSEAEYSEALEEMELLGLYGFTQMAESATQKEIPTWNTFV